MAVRRLALLAGVAGLLLTSPAADAIGPVSTPHLIRPGGGTRVAVGTFKYVEKSFTLKRGTWKTFRRPCPGGTHVWSGGESNNGAFSEVILAHSYPYDGSDGNSSPDDGWAVLVGGFRSKHTVTVAAVCSYVLAPDYVTTTASVGPRIANGSALMNCPPGHNPIAGGSRGDRTLQQTGEGPAMAGQWTVRANNVGNRTRTLTGFAVCTGYVFVTGNTNTSVSPRVQFGGPAVCPSGDQVIGGRVTTSDTTGSFATTTISASGPYGTSAWRANVDNFSASQNLPVTLTAYCITIPPPG